MLKSCMVENRLECGVDEAGAGPLAGPVVAAAVIWRSDLDINEYPNLKYIKDSKKLTPKKRAEMYEFIKEHAIDYAIASVDNETIDAINILKARIKAMQIALDNLNIVPEFILVDGNYWNEYSVNDEIIPHQCIIKGDDSYQSIAAASILAKEYRDQLMIGLHEQYPVYNWKKNKGYGTQEHRNAIKTHGPSPYHRKSFNWG